MAVQTGTLQGFMYLLHGASGDQRALATVAVQPAVISEVDMLNLLIFLCFVFVSSQAYHVTDAALGYFSPKQSHSLSILRLQSCWELTNHGVVNIGKWDFTGIFKRKSIQK